VVHHHTMPRDPRGRLLQLFSVQRFRTNLGAQVDVVMIRKARASRMARMVSKPCARVFSVTDARPGKSSTPRGIANHTVVDPGPAKLLGQGEDRGASAAQSTLRCARHVPFQVYRLAVHQTGRDANPPAMSRAPFGTAAPVINIGDHPSLQCGSAPFRPYRGGFRRGTWQKSSLGSMAFIFLTGWPARTGLFWKDAGVLVGNGLRQAGRFCRYTW